MVVNLLPFVQTVSRGGAGLRLPGGSHSETRQSLWFGLWPRVAQSLSEGPRWRSVVSFGGAVAANRMLDRATAQEIAETFYEDIIAPGYTDDALAILRRKSDLRILEVELSSFVAQKTIGAVGRMVFKRVSGGFLVQTVDEMLQHEPILHVVTEREPMPKELTNMMFAWRVVKHVKSHVKSIAVVLAKRLALVGVGAGQKSRVVTACRSRSVKPVSVASVASWPPTSFFLNQMASKRRC